MALRLKIHAPQQVSEARFEAERLNSWLVASRFHCNANALTPELTITTYCLPSRPM
jgi:hypothetical protein